MFSQRFCRCLFRRNEKRRNCDRKCHDFNKITWFLDKLRVFWVKHDKLSLFRGLLLLVLVWTTSFKAHSWIILTQRSRKSAKINRKMKFHGKIAENSGKLRKITENKWNYRKINEIIEKIVKRAEKCRFFLKTKSWNGEKKN